MNDSLLAETDPPPLAATPYYLEKGSSLRVHSMVERLRSDGYIVDVVCYDHGETPDIPGLEVFRTGIDSLVSTDAGPSITDPLNDIFLAIRAIQLCANRSYDLIQGEDVEGIAIALAAATRCDCEVIYDLHNPLSETLAINDIPVPRRLSRIVESFLYTRSDKILANWHQWERQITVDHDVDRIETVYDELPDEREPVDLPADQYVVYVGNFEPYQGVDLLVDAFESVVDDVTFDLILVGDPSAEIERHIGWSSACDRIHLLGRQPIQAANFLIENAEACAVPRRSGTQPGTKLVHYGMADVPIVATDLECNRELSRFDNPVLWAAPTADSIAAVLREVDSDE